MLFRLVHSVHNPPWFLIFGRFLLLAWFLFSGRRFRVRPGCSINPRPDPESPLPNDQRIIASIAKRSGPRHCPPLCVQCMQQYCREQRLFHPLVAAFLLEKCVENRMWENAECSTSQLEGLARQTCPRLQEGGTWSIQYGQYGVAQASATTVLFPEASPLSCVRRHWGRGAGFVYKN